MRFLWHFFALKAYRFFRTTRVGAIWICLVLGFAGNAPAQTVFKFTQGQKKQKIPFQLHRNLIIVQASLNGKGPYNFLIDTGVSSSIITDAGLRDSLKFSKGPALEIAGAGEGADLHAYFTPDLQVQMPGIVSENLTFAVLSEDVIQLGSYIGIPVTGILGFDFFNSFVVEINFKKLKLILHDPKEFNVSPKYESLPITIAGNKPFLATEVETATGQVPVNLLIDTGAGYALSLEVQLRPPDQVAGESAAVAPGCGAGRLRERLPGPDSGFKAGQIQS